MKGIFLCYLLLQSVYIAAQDYTHLLADINEWKLSYCFNGDCSDDTYYTDGDTLVNGTSYKILDGYHYISRTFLLREDIAQKQVHLMIIINGVQTEYLLYDFSLSIGDEMEMLNPITPFPENGGMFTLTDIVELPLVDGTNYKHYYFSPSAGNTASSWNAVWVEGVGSLSIITAPGGEPRVTEVGEVSCAYRNGNSFYANFSITDECEATLNILKSDSFSNLQIITEISNITLLNANAIENVAIYDLEGKKLFDNDYNNDSLNTIKIKTETFNKSTYILLLTNDIGIKKSYQILIR